MRDVMRGAVAVAIGVSVFCAVVVVGVALLIVYMVAG